MSRHLCSDAFLLLNSDSTSNINIDSDSENNSTPQTYNIQMLRDVCSIRMDRNINMSRVVDTYEL